MTEVGTRFEQFFAAVNEGRTPYPWQTALVEQIALTGKWPNAIAAPTGAGKTAVIDVHVFLVAERERQRRCSADGGSAPRVARPPRRLVLVAPRRVLVDDQFERASKLARQLIEVDHPVVVEVADALRKLLTTSDTERDDISPLGVTQLRGGVRLDLTWRLDPARCQIICATPQMWGSRLLMRGYRGSRGARNLESGLLGHDVVAVIDEAHLHERMIETATRVAANDPIAGALHVVAMSATRQSEHSVGLTDDDFRHDELRRRVRADKRIDLVEIDNWDGKGAVARAIAGAARELHGRGTVGVFVNTVRMALDVATLLDGSAVEIVCGRMRPADVQRLRDKRAGLLEARGNPNVDYLISTQSLEVGVDLDLPAMVSMIAPASALAQRAGRLNRSGTVQDAVLTIVAPAGLAQADPAELGSRFAPYDAQEIVDACNWIAELDGDASPARISATPLPASAKPPLPAITRTELETAAMTRHTLSADIDPAFYIEEPRDQEEHRVHIAARDHLTFSDEVVRTPPRSLQLPSAMKDHLTLSDDVVRQALRAAPPRAHELAPLNIASPVWRTVLDASPGSWVIRTDGRQTEAVRIDPEKKFTPRPGDVIVVPAGSPICTGQIVGTEGKRRGDSIDDVMAMRPDTTPDRIVLLDKDDIATALEEDATLGSRSSRGALADLLDDVGEPDLARDLRQRRLADHDVTWCADEETAEGLLVVAPTRNEGQLPRTALSAEPVLIDKHNADVEQRLAHVLDTLDVDDLGVTREQLLTAARWHDEGKRHPRFQRRMGGDPKSALAKPARGHKADRGDGWRHEPISAAAAWLASGKDPVPTVFTASHHGHGQPLFDRDAEAMLKEWPECEQPLADAVRELFGPSGRYELERMKLQRRIGIHRLAYLEALLRCADMQVSREGK